jgi:predicted sulfurtransferase
MEILNIAGYRFVPIESPLRLREPMVEAGKRIGVKGTILLAPEGINAFIAGTPVQVEAYLEYLNTHPEFSGIEFRKSWSRANPFKRFLVRMKKEIVTMRSDEVDPLREPAPHISPIELKALFDSGEEFILLDARKDFEFRMGHFEGAINLKLDHFSCFPEVVEAFPEEWKDKKVVTYCTGGIRCEKAAPLMIKRGFGQVRQLEGGILHYLESVGGDNFVGNCFVFDHRVLVNPQLEVVKDLTCRSCFVKIERSEENLMEPGLLQLCPTCKIENPQCAYQ